MTGNGIALEPYEDLPFIVLRGVPAKTQMSNIINGPAVSTAIFHCFNDYHYDSAFRQLWLFPGDLISMEHDIIATVDNIVELNRCPYPLCAFAYKVYPASTGLDYPMYAHRTYEGIPIGPRWTPSRPIVEGELFSDHAALGLTKLGYLARLQLQHRNPQLWIPTTWHELDTTISNAVRRLGYRWHIHWPEVEHDHR